MLAQRVVPIISEEDYLEMEKIGDIRHEYVDGYIYAMAGGTRAHNEIAVNIGSELHQKIKHTACKVYLNDVKLRIPNKRSYYYPDLMLGCSKNEKDEYFLTEPCLLIEVLSKSTAVTDRREKLLAYQSIPSLREYCIVTQNAYRLERYHRIDNNGLWHLSVYEKRDVVQFSCIDYEMTMEDIYAGILL